MTRVDIISGFLGAGKTTFIKKLISEVYQGEKIVLIENEFGEIGIDSRFMQHSGVEVTEMNSGCICCTLVGDFARSLKQVVDEFTPDRVIIEPSGVGKLSEVADAVMAVKDDCDIEISSRITVVDGSKIRMYIKNFNEFYSNQIEHASTLVVSRTQNMEEKKLKECVDILQEHNHDAAIITTPWDKLERGAVIDALNHGRNLEEELIHEHHEHQHDHDHDHHHADEIFTSWGIQTVHKFERSELEDILKMFSITDDFGQVLRAKGIVEGANGKWMEFDMVPDEIEIRECEPDYTGRICVIGTELNEEYLSQVLGK
ncbi:MAG: GTP-binding protein [Bacillota bacterium]|nr:GTP-binding protein [Bacillota bacterium]